MTRRLPPDSMRCTTSIVRDDVTATRCGRWDNVNYRHLGQLCTQHALMVIHGKIRHCLNCERDVPREWDTVLNSYVHRNVGGIADVRCQRRKA